MNFNQGYSGGIQGYLLRCVLHGGHGSHNGNSGSERFWFITIRNKNGSCGSQKVKLFKNTKIPKT